MSVIIPIDELIFFQRGFSPGPPTRSVFVACYAMSYPVVLVNHMDPFPESFRVEGVTSGRYMFEARIVEQLPVQEAHGARVPQPKHLLRIGVLAIPDLTLGSCCDYMIIRTHVY